MTTLALVKNPSQLHLPEVADYLKTLKRGLKEAQILSIGKEIKQELRYNHARRASAMPVPNGGFKEAAAQSKKFWSLYELVNRILDPLDPVYSGVRSGVALSTTADQFTLTAASAGQLRVLEYLIGGEATASAVNRVALQYSTGGATPTTATPEKFNSRSPAAASQLATGWTTQPTLAGLPIITLAYNAFGGVWRWVASPGEEIYRVNSEQFSVRSLSGTSVVSATIIWEEL